MRRALTLMVIVLAHIGLGLVLKLDPIQVRRSRSTPPPLLAEILGEDIGAAPSPQATPLTPEPRVELAVPDLPMDSMPLPSIDTPRIDPNLDLQIAPYLVRAQLADGEVATVILLLQVAADGSVISAQVVRSNGTDAANAAAMDYARATRWIPGTLDGVPQAMQASLTVILGDSA